MKCQHFVCPEITCDLFFCDRCNQSRFAPLTPARHCSVMLAAGMTKPLSSFENRGFADNLRDRGLRPPRIFKTNGRFSCLKYFRRQITFRNWNDGDDPFPAIERFTPAVYFPVWPGCAFNCLSLSVGSLAGNRLASLAAVCWLYCRKHGNCMKADVKTNVTICG